MQLLEMFHEKLLYNINNPLFQQKGTFILHFAIRGVDLCIIEGNFGGKNSKNKSYRMPFIVKKCKLFHF